ncbi:hypothetical protein [Novosphingobium sp. PhB57]|uniref:hypothetical protein n=1 Tax=Novosphingobium sp. PhB57 TaxID=2485107 RepID=UPI001051FF07|nr:hypothetical protein [Novosphingobium sp. PhB57]
MVSFTFDENHIFRPINPKLAKVEMARALYNAGSISKNEAARRVWHLNNKAGFENVEEDSAVQYIARRI